MRSIKRRSTIALAITVLLPLHACGGGSNSVSSNSAGSAETAETVETDSSSRTATTVAAATTTATSAVTTSATEAPDPSAASPTAVPPTDATPPAETSMPKPPVGDTVANSPMVQTAIADLRDRVGDPGADITIVSVEEVDWPDGSIGCPQPGMVYTQVMINGTKIVLQYEGINYDYHQGGRRDVFYCSPGAGKGAPTATTPPLDI